MKKLNSMFLTVLIILMFSACSTAEQHNKTENTSKNPEIITEQTESGAGSSEQQKILVVYFSATGTTEKISQTISSALKADIYEIIPEQPYTDADLAYNTDCRASREQNDSAARPAISGKITNFEEYGTIILGYPIWHGQAPRIINTFLESYNFSNKTIIPFCTSHSSGLGSSDTNLHGLCSEKTNWINGKAFYANTAESEIQQWLKDININK